MVAAFPNLEFLAIAKTEVTGEGVEFLLRNLSRIDRFLRPDLQSPDEVGTFVDRTPNGRRLNKEGHQDWTLRKWKKIY